MCLKETVEKVTAMTAGIETAGEKQHLLTLSDRVCVYYYLTEQLTIGDSYIRSKTP